MTATKVLYPSLLHVDRMNAQIAVAIADLTSNKLHQIMHVIFITEIVMFHYLPSPPF